ATEPNIAYPSATVLQDSLNSLNNLSNHTNDYTENFNELYRIQRDLRRQNVKNDFTIKVYETHVRFALEKHDLVMFKTCLETLVDLYELNFVGSGDELTAYTILYLIATENYKDDECIAHAVSVYNAFTFYDYESFFILFDKAPKMSGYLMETFVDSVRLCALEYFGAGVCELNLGFLARELGFIERKVLKQEKNFVQTIGCLVVEGADDDLCEWRDVMRMRMLDSRIWLEQRGGRVYKKLKGYGGWEKGSLRV
ncbi:hypothetical protein HK098_007536, partial [Nowakowskiella sp. JEL0407]